jgi:hypothetical protein
MERMDFTAANGFTFRVLYLPDGTSPNFPNMTQRHLALVEFYDLRFQHTPDGQFIGRYYLSTLMVNWPPGLDLNADVEFWTVDALSMDRVMSWLLKQHYADAPIEDRRLALAKLDSVRAIHLFLVNVVGVDALGETLDYLVQGAKDAEAADINRQGLLSQVLYLNTVNPKFVKDLASVLYD